jgi:hypothetical protein
MNNNINDDINIIPIINLEVYLHTLFLHFLFELLQ